MPPHQNGLLVQEAGTEYHHTHISIKLTELFKWMRSNQTLWQWHPNQPDLKLCFYPFGLTLQGFIPTHTAGFYHHKLVKSRVSSCINLSPPASTLCFPPHQYAGIPVMALKATLWHGAHGGLALPAAFTTSVKLSQGLLARKERLQREQACFCFQGRIGLFRYSRHRSLPNSLFQFSCLLSFQ